MLATTARPTTIKDTTVGVRTPKILVLDRGEELAQQVQHVADDLRPRPDIVSCTRLGSVGELLETEGPFDVLVAGPSLGTRSGLQRLGLIREELPGMSVVLAFSRRPDGSLREIVRAGAIDLLQLPVDDKELVESIDRAVELAQTATPVTTSVSTPAATTTLEPAERPLGRVFTISSATGGCGKTFFATNIAYFLVRHTGKRVCVLDLDLQFGEVVTALRLRPKFTIFDALQREDTDEDDLRAHIEEYTVAHETGVHVLAAPREPSEADRITPPDVTRIIEAVRKQFDYVIVDTPPQLNESVLAAFDLSDMLYVMATLDLPSVRNMSVFLSTLDRLKISTDNVKLILNKAESDVGIDIEQVTKLFPQGFQSVLPYAKEVSRSINLGMPVMAASPQAEISRLMATGMRPLLPAEAQARIEEAPVPKKRGLFARKRS
ncbi:MAG TPA: AAA family ATPase [Acidimicrobiales bacterium]|nr:AAA family ATPase [Acidimicrobiales bacterium]